jgi:hypothetical protein
MGVVQQSFACIYCCHTVRYSMLLIMCLWLLQDLKEALDAQLGSELSPVPPAAASYEAGDTRGAWALSMDEEGGGDLSGGEGSSGLGTGGLQEDDWDAIIDAAREEIEGMNGISSSLLSLEGQGDP